VHEPCGPCPALVNSCRCSSPSIRCDTACPGLHAACHAPFLPACMLTVTCCLPCLTLADHQQLCLPACLSILGHRRLPCCMLEIGLVCCAWESAHGTRERPVMQPHDLHCPPHCCHFGGSGCGSRSAAPPKSARRCSAVLLHGGSSPSLPAPVLPHRHQETRRSRTTRGTRTTEGATAGQYPVAAGLCCAVGCS
jgi:hypothetical protein